MEQISNKFHQQAIKAFEQFFLSSFNLCLSLALIPSNRTQETVSVPKHSLE